MRFKLKIFVLLCENRENVTNEKRVTHLACYKMLTVLYALLDSRNWSWKLAFSFHFACRPIPAGNRRMMCVVGCD